MKFMKTLPMALVVLLVAVFANPAEMDEVPLEGREGTIHEVEISTNTLVIDGVRFHVALDAEVEIRGSYGAFTMLEPGMKVVYEYRIYSDTNVEIVLISQLPDNQELEES